ncbi:MAG: LD-carboxypeptidase [Bacteroidaceae bacterium]|nr:LD-carboxypeptidase [Bacteroidaceae bacterium]
MRKYITMAVAVIMATMTLTSCSKDDEGIDSVPIPDDAVVLNCAKPDYLKAGDKVAMISPSYYTPMETIEKAANVLRSWGFEPVIAPNVDKVLDGKIGGTVEERVSDIRWALDDPSIKAILCNRGGYGTIQLIDQLPFDEVKAARKWIIGYSDISTLHGFWSRAGVMSILGTMSTTLAKGGTDTTCMMMRDLLLGKVPRYEVPVHQENILGQACGVLVGGNLCTIAPNVGSRADATEAKDLILFVEEIGENMRNIDRQMRLLKMNGVFDHCKGVVLGEFISCGTEFTDVNGEVISVEAMLHDLLSEYHIPVLCGFPTGHGDINLPLVMGAPVTIDVRTDEATLQFDIDGDQQTVNTATITATPTPVAVRMRMAGKIE